ncbi:MAG TPA: spermidine/putrescine ABC transporter substrate-binding protein [Thermoanaerobaculaceae bacterium]|nr:spermidine/putrescine ABC transporter substrate-binding protein [Thermoanaerobaculaceae bacterium]HRS16995.1 spermidine/putrescine ABC transporter substrate-binding protein [Thermoanaerobaculaceae bacterium]
MKSTLVKALSFLVAVSLVAAGGCKHRPKELRVYTWADYIKPEVLARFERQEGCSVVIDTFDSNEAMYAKLKAGATGYDVITPSSYMVQVMHGQGMLQALDHSRLPNIAHVDKEILAIAIDKQMHHSVPYMLTITGIAYLRSKVSEAKPSWAMLDRAELAGRMTMLNDMRETMGAALKFLGCSLNSTDEAELAKARDVVIRWKRNLAKFENEQYKTGLASGEFWLVHGYSGDILQVQGENEDIVFAVPEEGTSFACDDLVIPKDAPDAELAHRFINYLHDPQVAAENTEFISYLCPNSASYSLLSAETRANPALFPSNEVRARCEVIVDLGEHNALYTKMWDEVKDAR